MTTETTQMARRAARGGTLLLAATFVALGGCATRAEIVNDKPNTVEVARAPEHKNDPTTGTIAAQVTADGVTPVYNDRKTKKTSPETTPVTIAPTTTGATPVPATTAPPAPAATTPGN